MSDTDTASGHFTIFFSPSKFYVIRLTVCVHSAETFRTMLDIQELLFNMCMASD